MQVATAVGLTVSGGITPSHTLTFKEEGISRIRLVEINVTGGDNDGGRDATISFYAGGNAVAFMSFALDEFIPANFLGAAGTVGDEAELTVLTGFQIAGWRRFRDGIPVKDKLSVTVLNGSSSQATTINHFAVLFW
jgi:hypothetical protein